MEELVARDEQLKNHIDNISEIKSVAFILVLAIIVETNGFELVKYKS